MKYKNRFLTDVLGNTLFYVIVFLELTFHSCSQACFKLILLTHHLSERCPSQQVTAGVFNYFSFEVTEEDKLLFNNVLGEEGPDTLTFSQFYIFLPTCSVNKNSQNFELPSLGSCPTTPHFRV